MSLPQGQPSYDEIARRLLGHYPGWFLVNRSHYLQSWVWAYGFYIQKASDAPTPKESERRWICKECMFRNPPGVLSGSYCGKNHNGIMNHLYIEHNVSAPEGQKKGPRELMVTVGPVINPVPIAPPAALGDDNVSGVVIKRSSSVDDTVSSAPTAPLSLSSLPNYTTDASSSALNEETARDVLLPGDDIGYEGINWSRLVGFSMPQDSHREPSTIWIWDQGFDVEKDDSGHRFWICKQCHQREVPLRHMFDATFLNQASMHLEKIHRINADGPMPPQRKKQRTFPSIPDLGPKTSFSYLHYQNLLTRWVACDNIPYHKLDSPYFRDLIRYLNDVVADSGCVPDHRAIRDYTIQAFDSHKGVVTSLLYRALSRIHVSTEMRSSGKFTALIGLNVFFLDADGKSRTLFLSLPQIEGRHSGENLADRVKEILREYETEDRVGFFIRGNVDPDGPETTNDGNTTLPCCGHIINLVARSILFGLDLDRIEQECRAYKEIQEESSFWRVKGWCVGKLHNIVHWVHRDSQRIQKLHDLQSSKNLASNLVEQKPLDVVLDNGTRWNAFLAMMKRGYELRNELDFLVKSEVTAWSNYVIKTQNGRYTAPETSRKKPAIVDDVMTPEDWSSISNYLAILEPFEIATKRLGGQPQEGKPGATWEVLLTFKWLLQHMELVRAHHERDEVPAIRLGCGVGQSKLIRIYARVKENPAYVAAIALHPAFRWRTVELQWATEPDWVATQKIAVQKIWEQYREPPAEQNMMPEQPMVARQANGFTELDNFMESVRNVNTQTAFYPAKRDEYAEWTATADLVDCSVDNPIQYWVVRKHQYPRLSKMAIDILSIPPMSAEPERIFNLAEQVVTEGGLEPDLVGTVQSLASWEKSGIIHPIRKW